MNNIAYRLQKFIVRFPEISLFDCATIFNFIHAYYSLLLNDLSIHNSPKIIKMIINSRMSFLDNYCG